MVYVVHTYEYLNGLLMHETRGEQAYDYYYDANGQLYAVSYKLSETDTKKVYYFTHNWRGDIVGIYNGNGDLKATYEYDAWGNVLSIEDANGNAITSATHIANLNPFRYRGYYMDTETGLYYLMSRYYDSVTHRFVNADGYFQSGGTLLDTNMNAYCRNNPINCFDPTGAACSVHNPGYMPSCSSCNFLVAEHRDLQQRRQKLVKAPDLDVNKASSNSYNCYGNGIGKQINTNPTGYITGESTRDTFERVKKDLGSSNVRELTSINDAINSNEFKVALKCGPTDYHFIRLTNAGWYNKSGTAPGLYIDQDVVTADIWYAMWINNGQIYRGDPRYGFPYYDDQTIYFAVKVEWDEQ